MSRPSVSASARRSPGTIRCGMTEVNHEPGPSTTHSAARIASIASSHASGSSGTRATDSIWPSVVATSTWPRTTVMRVRVVGVGAPHPRGDVHRRGRHRQHPAVGAEQPAHPVERADVVAHQLPQRDDQQVADDVALHLAVAGEAVLDDLGPGAAPLVVAAQRGERHPQVARGQHAELAAQPARRAAVVGDRHDGGQVVDGEVVVEAAQRRQGGERGRARHRGRPRPARCPRSHVTPCRGRGGRCGRRSRRRASGAAIASVIATLRCLPPVQPTATCMKRLPSTR